LHSHLEVVSRKFWNLLL